MKSICVFCASSLGNRPEYAQLAYALGKLMAARNIKLVFGGSKIGLMGEVARGVLENGGYAIGIIPAFLARKEVAHDGIQELITVKSMHERKKMMSELSEGFIALPGGFGTLEELCEILTWAQLQLIKAPVGVLNWQGYYDHLAALLLRMTDDGLLKNDNRLLLYSDTTAEALISQMEKYQPPTETFWTKVDLT